MNQPNQIETLVKEFADKLRNVGVWGIKVKCESDSEDVYRIGRLHPHSEFFRRYRIEFQDRVIGVD